MKISKAIFWWIVTPIFFIILIALSFDESRAFIIAFFFRIMIFLKRNLISLLTTFFLVNGKFIFSIFLKKLTILAITGLGKRYLIEKIVMGNIKVHLLDHISKDIKRAGRYSKNNFSTFPIIKQVITIIVFISSLGFMAKFMGGMLALKLFLAKVWSFLLLIFLKISGAVVYFFTDYLWHSWLAPIIEFILSSWILSWMEKIPFLSKSLKYIYAFFVEIFRWIEYYLGKFIHTPVKKILKWLVRIIQGKIYQYIGYENYSLWRKLRRSRVLTPNSHTKLINKRVKNAKKRKEKKHYISSRTYLIRKRFTRLVYE